MALSEVEDEECGRCVAHACLVSHLATSVTGYMDLSTEHQGHWNQLFVSSETKRNALADALVQPSWPLDG